jgi:integrase
MRGHVQRRGRKSYRLKWDLDVDPKTGKRVTKYRTVKGTKRDAEAELARILGAIQMGAYVDPTNITVSTFLIKWRDDVVATSVSRKTLERYGDHIDRIIAALGSVRLAKLTPLAIQSFYTELRSSGHKRRDGGLSEQSVLHIHKVLTAALSRAVKWRLIPCNPASDVAPPRPEHTEMRTLNEAEIGQLLAAAESTPLYVPLLVCLTTGLRRGELLGLKWRDLDFDTGRLSIVRSLEETSQGLALKAPKTGRNRRVLPLPETTLRHLRRHELSQKEQRLRVGAGWQDMDLVFPDPTGGLWRPRNLTKGFRRMAKQADLDGITLHGLRHTHITQLLRAGVNAKVVSERVGHSSVAFTLQRYAHALPDMQQDAADQAEALVGRLASQ